MTTQAVLYARCRSRTSRRPATGPRPRKSRRTVERTHPTSSQWIHLLGIRCEKGRNPRPPHPARLRRTPRRQTSPVLLARMQTPLEKWQIKN